MARLYFANLRLHDCNYDKDRSTSYISTLARFNVMTLSRKIVYGSQLEFFGQKTVINRLLNVDMTSHEVYLILGRGSSEPRS